MKGQMGDERMQDFERVLDISRQMAETRVLEPLLEYAMDVAIELVGAESGYLVLLEHESSLIVRVRRTTNDPALDTQISQSILRQVIASGEPILTGHALADPRFEQSASVAELKLKSVLCVPLIAHGSVIGGLYVENRSTSDLFAEDDLNLLRFFASQAAVAIENAMLNDRLEGLVMQRTARLEQEILERRYIERQLMQLKLEKERVELLASFIQDASHQFRTPLTIIRTNLDILCRQMDVDPKTNHYATGIHHEINAIVELVDSLTYMARLDTNSALRRQGIDLNDVARDVYMAYGERETFVLEPSERPVIVIGDRQYLRRAVIELVKNALQFTPADGTITLRVERGGVIAVSDSGSGIHPDEQPLVFHRFYRADKARTTRGFGMGLAIVQKIAELHNGRVELESVPGQGSTFILTLPESHLP